jgi:hypothetical protein
VAGRPHTRAKREVALRRREDVGAERAAAEVGVPVSKLEQWAAEAGQPPPKPPPGPRPEDAPQRNDFTTQADYLRALADHCRAGQALAERREAVLLDERPADARAAGEVADRRGRRAELYERAAQEAAEAEHQLLQRDADVLMSIVRALLQVCDVRFAGATARLVRELFSQAAAGGAVEVSDALKLEVREEVASAWRSRLGPDIETQAREALLEELAQREEARQFRERPELPPGPVQSGVEIVNAEPVEGPEKPADITITPRAWEPLPEPWRRGYGAPDHPGLSQTRREGTW